jgi:hypothetical protein
MAEVKEIRIEKWFVGPYDLIYGYVYGHPNISDGSEIKTSRIVTWDTATNKIKTKNTNYTLGEPAHEFIGKSNTQSNI